MAVQVGDRRGLGARARLILWGGAAALMVAPVVAMRLNEEIAWDPGDFLFLAILATIMGAVLESAARVSAQRAYLFGAGLALVTAALQLWINLAVGIVGSEEEPINLVYAGVVAVAVIGSALARLQPRGMAIAMIAAAVAQVGAFIAVLAAGLGFTGPITIFFTALWLIAASLFARAGR